MFSDDQAQKSCKQYCNEKEKQLTVNVVAMQIKGRIPQIKYNYIYGGGKLPKVFSCDHSRVDLSFCYIPQIRKANSQGKKDIIKPKQHRRDSSKAICHFLLKTCVRLLANKMRFDAPLK